MLTALENFIYGPPVMRGHTLTHTMRPTRIDMDTVREVANLASELLIKANGPGEPVKITYETESTRPGSLSRRVHPGELNGLSVDERGRLTLKVQQGPAEVFISFTASGIHGSMIHTNMLDRDQAIIDQEIRAPIRDKIIHDGVPVFRPRRLVRPAYAAACVAIAALWVWALTTAPPLPFAILGTIAIVLAIGWTIRRAREFVVETSMKRMSYVGHQIIGETRAETNSRRADHRRDRIVAFYGAVVGIIVGFVVALLSSIFGLRS